MMLLIITQILVLVINSGLVTADPPPVCMSSPTYSFQPGIPISAQLDSNGKRCEATVTFANNDFLPLNIAFPPLNCLGFQSAVFMLPPEVPNGNAFILWGCAGQSPMCNQAVISGGIENPDSIIYNQSGDMNCLVPYATQTTFSTSIGSSTTIVDTMVSTAFATVTNALDTKTGTSTDKTNTRTATLTSNTGSAQTQSTTTNTGTSTTDTTGLDTAGMAPTTTGTSTTDSNMGVITPAPDMPTNSCDAAPVTVIITTCKV